MSGIETRFAADVDAESIRAAFYGVVERHGGDVEGPAHIRTEIEAGGPQITVRLWSVAAMNAFLRDVKARRSGPR